VQDGLRWGRLLRLPGNSTPFLLHTHTLFFALLRTSFILGLFVLVFRFGSYVNAFFLLIFPLVFCFIFFFDDIPLQGGYFSTPGKLCSLHRATTTTLIFDRRLLLSRFFPLASSRLSHIPFVPPFRHLAESKGFFPRSSPLSRNPFFLSSVYSNIHCWPI